MKEARRLAPPFFSYSHRQAVTPGDECSYAIRARRSRGLTFYEGGDFPAAYKGALFFADAVRAASS